jgi:uncharacterized protein (UPF0335 family)
LKAAQAKVRDMTLETRILAAERVRVQAALESIAEQMRSMTAYAGQCADGVKDQHEHYRRLKQAHLDEHEQYMCLKQAHLEEERAALKAEVASILAQARRTVEDWKHMHARAGEQEQNRQLCVHAIVLGLKEAEDLVCASLADCEACHQGDEERRKHEVECALALHTADARAQQLAAALAVGDREASEMLLQVVSLENGVRELQLRHAQALQMAAEHSSAAAAAEEQLQQLTVLVEHMETEQDKLVSVVEKAAATIEAHERDGVARRAHNALQQREDKQRFADLEAQHVLQLASVKAEACDWKRVAGSCCDDAAATNNVALATANTFY